MTDYLVTLNEPGPYRIGVDYEIPTKSIQYGNIILDNINSQFTGVAHTFTLYASGDSYVPINDQQLIVVKNNLVMEPIEDFTTSTNNIIFTVAPNPGDDVFIIALATTADLTRTINYIVDSGSISMLSGSKPNCLLNNSLYNINWNCFCSSFFSLLPHPLVDVLMSIILMVFVGSWYNTRSK